MVGNPEFGKRIRDLREAKKIAAPKFSLRQFAQAAGISATYLSKVETGDFVPPAPETIKKMAALLPDLSKIIMEQPKAMADFLRVAHGLSEEDIQKLTEQIRVKKE